MTILVEDVNDNPPYFASGTYTATVAEGGEYGSYVTDIQAYDDDIGENAYRFVKYRLISYLLCLYITCNSNYFRPKYDRRRAFASIFMIQSSMVNLNVNI